MAEFRRASSELRSTLTAAIEEPPAKEPEKKPAPDAAAPATDGERPKHG
jgi:hypothetical protein